MKIDRISTDAADFLRSVDLLFVRLELRSLGAVVIRAQVGLGSGRVGHRVPPFGYKNSTPFPECFSNIRLKTQICRKIAKCCLKISVSEELFQFHTENTVEVVDADPRALLLDDDRLAVIGIVVPLVFPVGDRLAALERDLDLFRILHPAHLRDGMTKPP